MGNKFRSVCLFVREIRSGPTSADPILALSEAGSGACAGLRGVQGKQHRAERAKTKGLRKRERQQAALAETKALATTTAKAKSMA